MTVHAKPEAAPERAYAAAGPDGVLACSDLLDKLAGEVELLRRTLGKVERAMCDMIDEKGIPIDGEVAVSLQQLDLAVQTTGVLTDLMRVAAEETSCEGHRLDALLAEVPLHDIADRIRGHDPDPNAD